MLPGTHSAQQCKVPEALLGRSRNISKLESSSASMLDFLRQMTEWRGQWPLSGLPVEALMLNFYDFQHPYVSVVRRGGDGAPSSKGSWEPLLCAPLAFSRARDLPLLLYYPVLTKTRSLRFS